MNTTVPTRPDYGVSDTAYFRVYKVHGHYSTEVGNCTKYSMSLSDKAKVSNNYYCYNPVDAEF